MRILVALSTALALAATILFVLTSIRVGPAAAFTILLGINSPFALDSGLQGVALALAGYLVIPTAVGSLLAIALEAAVNRTPEEREADLDRLAEKIKRHRGTR